MMVATPDHTHAVITMAALKRGKHVYCEKPLTYSVYEARQVTEAARQAKVATQLGNQGQASEEARIVCELIGDGAIGAGARGPGLVPGPVLELADRGRAGRRRRRRCPTAWIGICGWARRPSGPIIRPTARGRGATGGTSARACWATCGATRSRPSSRP